MELDVVLDEHSPVNEWCLTGAVGTGKTTSAVASQLNQIYRLTCLKDPVSYFGLLPGSIIVFAIFSITLDAADDGYELVKQWMKISPYFRDVVPREIRPDNPISIPSKNIEIRIGSLEGHALGKHLFGFILDEANFFKQSKRRRVTQQDRTRAHDLYTAGKRRQKSRFLRSPGLVCLVSSEQTETDFTQDRVTKAESDPSIHVTRFAQWDIPKQEHSYSGRTFQVLIGDGRNASRVLEEDEVVPASVKLLDVPVEHLEEFEEDTEEAIRDVAGLPVSSAGKFFALRDRIYSCIDYTRQHPFTLPVITSLSSEDVDADLFEYVNVGQLLRVESSRQVPIVHRNAPRVGHVDIGVTNDPLGLAIGHNTPTGQIYYDMLLRVTPPKHGEVDLDAIVEFFKSLREHGYRFSSISYDQYQSKQSIQQLNKVGFIASRISAEDLAVYRTLRRRIYGGPASVSYYNYEPALQELSQVDSGPPGKAPDHPPHGTKDVIDAMAVVAFVLDGQTAPGKRRHAERERIRASMPTVGILD